MPKIGHEFYEEDRITISNGGPGLPFVIAEVINHDWCRVDNRWCKIEDLIPLEEAPAYYTEKIRLGGDSTRLLHLRGAAWEYRGEYKLAVFDFTDGLKLEPANEGWLTSRATAYYRLGDTDKAIRDIRKAIELKPDNWHPQVMLAWLLSTAPDERFRDSTEALAIVDKLIAKDGKFGQLKPVMAAVYANASRFDEAAAYHEESVTVLQKTEKSGWREQWRQERLRFHRARLELYRAHKPFRDTSRSLDWFALDK